MKNNLIEILRCPLCKGKLEYNKQKDEYVCKADRVAFMNRDGIPVMLDDEGRTLAAEEEV